MLTIVPPPLVFDDRCEGQAHAREAIDVDGHLPFELAPGRRPPSAPRWVEPAGVVDQQASQSLAPRRRGIDSRSASVTSSLQGHDWVPPWRSTSGAKHSRIPGTGVNFGRRRARSGSRRKCLPQASIGAGNERPRAFCETHGSISLARPAPPAPPRGLGGSRSACLRGSGCQASSLKRHAGEEHHAGLFRRHLESVALQLFADRLPGAAQQVQTRRRRLGSETSPVRPC